MDFADLHNTYSNFFRIAENPPWPHNRYNHVYFMAFDAEWYQSGSRNVVLSYQIATVSRQGSKNIIEFVPPGKRLTLAEIVEFGIRSVNNDKIPDSHADARNLVILISHSTVAEWSVLADRDAPYITEQLTAIRKSPVTSVYPIKIVLGDYLCPCHVQLYDTRLIAPADFQSLKKLSTMLGSDDELKVTIGHHNLMRMKWLIANDYPLYEKYSLQDSEITLKLFFLLQSTLMELSHYGIKLYRTLASGAVKGYQLRAPCYDFYQEALKNGPYSNLFTFIRSAYHGGRNEGFLVGRSEKHPETSDRLWVDIDFVGCYPTAMALCPVIDCGVNPFWGRPRGNNRKALLKIVANPPADGVKYLPLRYKLPSMTTAELQEAGISKDHYDTAKKILDRITPASSPDDCAKGMGEFGLFLEGIKGRHERDRLREKSVVYDNSLVDEWYARSSSSAADPAAETTLIPGFAKVRFAFDMEIIDGKEVEKSSGISLYPCLPVVHPSYGLIYPLRGECYATASEIVLAMDAGALIKAMVSVELPVVKDGGSQIASRLFFDHLADLTKQRNKHKKIIKETAVIIKAKQGTSEELGAATDKMQNSIVMERFIKEFMNSFYGKTAQAINFKKMYDPSTGMMVSLGASPLSEACTSALSTGLPRAALSSMLLAIDRYNQVRPEHKQIVIASCTTDGLLVGLPRPEGVTAAQYYDVVVKKYIEPVVNGKGGRKIETSCLEEKKVLPSVNEILELCGCGGLIPLYEGYMPMRQMRASRKELTTEEDGKFDDTFLEIKHFADDIAGIKTRGQIGWVHYEGEDIVTIQAKFGLKPPVTDIIRQKLEAECVDTMVEAVSLKLLNDEYDRVMDAGGSVKATLECNWIKEQLKRIESGETDVFEYTFYGLKSFNEIIKGGGSDDLTQTKDPRKFNADFDWKRKLVMKDDGSVCPISVPHADVKEMVSYRGHVEKSHRWREIATPIKIIQQRALAHSPVRNTGGPAAKLVRLFLTGMFHGHIPGELKASDFASKKQKRYQLTVERLNRIWNELDFVFETREQSKKEKESGGEPKKLRNKQQWQVHDLKKCVAEDKWVECVNLPTERLEKLLEHLCADFGVNHETARKNLFAYGVRNVPDTGLLLYLSMAILKAPGAGIEPFARLYLKSKLPTREELIREFQPHLTEEMIASREHFPFRKGECTVRHKQTLTTLFRKVRKPGVKADDIERCVKVLIEGMEAPEKAPRNRGEAKCIRLFAQALRMPDIVAQPLSVKEIVDKLERYNFRRRELYRRRNSSFEYNSIKGTPENLQLIRKLARLFKLDPEPFVRNMVGP